MSRLRHVFAAAFLVVAALPLATVGAGNPVYAAAGADDLAAAADAKLVTDIQRRLSELGLYRAPLDGRVTPATATAIRTYQRGAGLKVDGRPSRALLVHLNSAEAQGERLLERLGKVRDAQIEAARRALGSHAPAGDIVASAPALEGRAGTTNAAACSRRRHRPACSTRRSDPRSRSRRPSSAIGRSARLPRPGPPPATAPPHWPLPRR